jgi:hypothetical protein
MLQTFEEDMDVCCNHSLADAAIGNPDLQHFECPECGMVLKPTIYNGTVKHWSQYPSVELIKL